MMPRPQFRLRSLFILTAIVAVGLVGQRYWRNNRVIDREQIDIGVTLTKYGNGRVVAEVATPTGPELLTFPRVPDSNGRYLVETNGLEIEIKGNWIDNK
jgi:hypothetical protein